MPICTFFIIDATKQILKKYKDIFVWTYKDLKGIPPHLVHHQIDLDTNIPTSHQAWYHMNLNYVTVVKHDLDKLLVVGFIVLVEEATWLSPIMVVLKKTKTSNLHGFSKIELCHKKKFYGFYLLQKKYSICWEDMKSIHFRMAFQVIVI